MVKHRKPVIPACDHRQIKENQGAFHQVDLIAKGGGMNRNLIQKSIKWFSKVFFTFLKDQKNLDQEQKVIKRHMDTVNDGFRK